MGASTGAPTVKKVKFLECMSGPFGAIFNSAPSPAMDEGRTPASGPVTISTLPGRGMGPTEAISGPDRQESLQRKTSLPNRSRAPRISRLGPARMEGRAITGGSLDARLSHRPARRRRDTGGKNPWRWTYRAQWGRKPAKIKHGMGGFRIDTGGGVDTSPANNKSSIISRSGPFPA